MMNKAIYWIDDSTTGILNIVNSVFPYFWKINDDEGIETHIKIIGNETQAATDLKLWTIKDEEDFKKQILDMFEQLCVDNDDFGEKGLFEKKINLIEKNIQIMYKLEDNDSGEYRKLYSVWKNNEVITDEARESAKNLLNKMNIVKGACVGLDLALLKGDMEKVSAKKQPILSMQLYNILQQKHKCFLYSKYGSQDPFVEGWKEVYESTFNDSNPIIIQKRCGLFEKNISKKEIDELLKLVDESYEQEVNRHAGNVE